jgi:hypothetical protein
MKVSTVGVVVMAVLQASAFSAELPDCKLDQGNFPGQALRGFARKSQTRYFMEVEGALKNGAEVSYERDEAVLNGDLRVVRTTPALTPSVDATLKSSWLALSTSFRFTKGRPLRYWSEAELSDGRRFGMLEMKDGAVLFFDQANEFCNKTLSIKPDMQVWQAGTLSKEPDEVIFERSLQDDVTKTGSLRIIYLGTTAGAMKFQEVWVQGSRIGKSIARTFDQFSKSIDIAGFKFQVIEAKGDKVKLKYDIASRTEITAEQSNQIALQNTR